MLAGCEASEDTEPKSGAPERISFAELGPCGEAIEPEGFRCGSIEVPFERSDPSYGKTEIGFAVRRRDRRDQPSLGAIFAQEGGPGYSSTGSANAYTKLFGDLLERRELVLVDMRGIGLSNPIDCPDLQRGFGPDAIALPECARRLGKRFISYRTSAGADDMNDVRKALGLDQIALYGDSYGTFFGQSYAFRHGETTRRPGARLRLSDPRRVGLVFEPDRDREPGARAGLRALARVPAGSRRPARQAGRAPAQHGPNGRVAARGPGRHPATAPRTPTSSSTRRGASCAPATRTPGTS